MLREKWKIYSTKDDNSQTAIVQQVNKTALATNGQQKHKKCPSSNTPEVRHIVDRQRNQGGHKVGEKNPRIFQVLPEP